MVYSSRVDTQIRESLSLASSLSYQFSSEQFTVIIIFNKGLEEAGK